MAEKDAYGALFKIGLLPKEGVKTAGVRVIQDGDADAALDYEIDLTKASDNTIDVYIVEGNPTLWYNEEEAVFQPVIAEAYFSETTSKQGGLCIPVTCAQEYIILGGTAKNHRRRGYSVQSGFGGERRWQIGIYDIGGGVGIVKGI